MKENFVNRIKLTENVTYIDVNMNMVKEYWKRRDIDFIKKHPLLVSLDLNLDELHELVDITGSDDVKEIIEERLKIEENMKAGDLKARLEIAENLLNNDYEPEMVSMITDLSLDDVYEIIQNKL